MTASTKQKRLDKIEILMSPREWAIKLADEIRKYPNTDAYIRATSYDKARRPYVALDEQIEERYLGKKPEDARARSQLLRKLQIEYITLVSLILDINKYIGFKIEAMGLRAVLGLSRLHNLLLEDTFGRTASKAALRIGEYKTADADEEKERQIILKELATYTDVSLAEKPSDSLPLGTGLRLRFPSPIEIWVQEIVRLTTDIFSHKAAIQLIQDEHFDGHAFLFRGLEATLEETIKAIEDGVIPLNKYLKTRETLFKDEWVQEDQEDGIPSAIPGEREAQLTIDLEDIKDKAKGRGVAALVDEWIKIAKEEALTEVLRGSPDCEQFHRKS
jgi:hypothetical protein